MAYVSQERKKSLVAGVKKVLEEKFPDVKIKCSFSVEHNSSLVMTIQGCSINLLADNPERSYLDVNTYYIKEHFKGIARDLLTACHKAMNVGNHDNSDAMTDYFDVGWYISIRIGKWDKPFKVLDVKAVEA